jgi:hypothetical protein
MQISKTRSRNQQGTRNEKLLFKSANFQYQKHNDSIMLVGNLQLFQNYQNEPDKPINITLLQKTKNEQNEKQETGNSVAIYPNPINDLFNVSITMQQETKAIFTIYTQTGKQVFQHNQHLQKGKQIIPINVKLSQGVYIIKINTEKETISRVLIKAN